MSREYPPKPVPAVSVALFCGEEVLLIQRGKEPNKGRYSLPGGGQRLGESSQEAARREVQEETRLEVSGLRLVEVLDRLQRDEEGLVQFHYVIVVFAAEVSPIAKAQSAASSDAVGLVWVTPTEANDLPLTDGLPEVLQRARRALS